jgi:hypothetical protein
MISLRKILAKDRNHNYEDIYVQETDGMVNFRKILMWRSADSDEIFRGFVFGVIKTNPLSVFFIKNSSSP